jgi:hypothetical protein
VIGSSELARREGKVHWKPVEKPADFDPSQRWSHWSNERHDRFIWIAGEALSRLGYPAEIRSKSRLLWITSNTLVDLRNTTRSALGRMLRAVGLGTLPRIVRGAGASFGALLERKNRGGERAIILFVAAHGKIVLDKLIEGCASVTDSVL